MIPELLKSIAGSFTRFALTGIGAYLVHRGVITQEDVQTLIVGAGMSLAALAWSLYQKYRERLNFLTALSMPPASSEADVKIEAKSRNQAVWSIPLALLLIPAAFSACGEDRLKTIAANIDRAAILVEDGREIRDELFTQGVIDRDDAYKVTLGLQRVNGALKAFNNRAQTYKSAGALTPEGKTLLKKLAEDIGSAATELVSDGTFGVKNPDAQARINAIIGSIRQVTLAIVDAVGLLKTKPAPVQQQGFDPLSIVPLLLLLLRQAMAFVAAERARTGKTADEIFTDAGVRLEANDAALFNDLLIYAPSTEGK